MFDERQALTRASQKHILDIVASPLSLKMETLPFEHDSFNKDHNNQRLELRSDMQLILREHRWFET